MALNFGLSVEFGIVLFALFEWGLGFLVMLLAFKCVKEKLGNFSRFLLFVKRSF